MRPDRDTIRGSYRDYGLEFMTHRQLRNLLRLLDNAALVYFVLGVLNGAVWALVLQRLI